LIAGSESAVRARSSREKMSYVLHQKKKKERKRRVE
jgi:hypothetical protein